MMFSTDRAKPKSTKEMAIVNKRRNKSGTDNKFMHMNNINITKLLFFCET